MLPGTVQPKTGGATQHPRSHLFLVRMWLEDLAEGKNEWRGQLTIMPSGEVRYFREWPVLIMILQERLASPGRAAKDA